MERDYCSTAGNLGCKVVAGAMPENRFHEMKRFCHVADNSALSESRIAKMEPLYIQLKQSLMQYGIFSERLSIDESRIPYYEHHGAKMFMRGKPIRFGYKIWMLCFPDGYPYQADIYCGRSTRPSDTPLGEHVILKFADLLPQRSEHILFFNNFFTSYNLLIKLHDMDVKATRMVRDGRTG